MWSNGVRGAYFRVQANFSCTPQTTQIMGNTVTKLAFTGCCIVLLCLGVFAVQRAQRRSRHRLRTLIPERNNKQQQRNKEQKSNHDKRRAHEKRGRNTLFIGHRCASVILDNADTKKTKFTP